MDNLNHIEKQKKIYITVGNYRVGVVTPFFYNCKNT